MSNLLRYKKDAKFVVFDFETEGLNLVTDRPWQLSWLTTEGEQIKTEHDKYLFFNDLCLSEGARQITGFNESSYLSSAEDPKVALEAFVNDISDPNCYIVGHNILGFDVYILEAACRNAGVELDPSYIDRCIDTNCLAKAIEMNIEFNKNSSFIEWQYKLCDIRQRKVKTSISHLLKKYKIQHNEGMLHNALYDINVNFKIFRKQLWEIEI